MTEALSLHSPSVLRGSERVRRWRETGYPPHWLVDLCRDLDVRRWLLVTGWTGTDGSSCSFDDIQGVRIGRTGGQFNRLPATLHDVAYELIRRFRPPSSVRATADAMYRDECILKLQAKLVRNSLSYRVGVAQCHSRYVVLRLFGWRAARSR